MPVIPYPTDGKIQKQTSIGYERDLWVPGSDDYDVYTDSFHGDSLDARYPAAKTNGASAAVTFTEHSTNAFLDLISGTDANGYAGQGYGMQLTGDRGVLATFIVRTPAVVTSMKFEVGLSDNDQDAGAVNVKATPSATATDYAVFVMDTTDDAIIAFHSAKGGTIVATEGLGTVTINTTYRFAIRIEGDNIQAYINGEEVAGHGKNAGIEGGTDITPWVFCQARAGSASRTLQWHRWRAIQPAY